MTRPLRIQYPGALYQIIVRGNAGNTIFLDDDDRVRFLKNFGTVCKRFSWSCYAYCLLDSEYQLLIETSEANLSRGMREVNGVYTQATNRKYQQRGHILEGRYQAIVLEKEAYLAEIHRKIVLLPVHRQLVSSPIEWNWSNYRGLMGKDWIASWLNWKTFLMTFSGNTGEARRKYADFIAENNYQNKEFKPRSRILLGSERFIKEISSKITDKLNLKVISRPQEKMSSLEQFQLQSNTRNQAIQAAFACGGFTLKQIGEYFGLHYTTVSRIANSQIK